MRKFFITCGKVAAYTTIGTTAALAVTAIACIATMKPMTNYILNSLTKEA